ncbi:S1/P1 nuclease, partial [Nostoc sp. NIES-2111]
MIDYVARNWIDCVYPEGVVDETKNRGCHQTYHFDDVAIQRDRFDRNYAGTNDHDLVAATNAAMAVLLGRPAPPPFSIKDKKEALFMLAHLVGDMTQPLHVGALYLDEKGALADPDVSHTIDPSTETAGANLIFDGTTAFHSEWDGIPKDLGDTAPPELVATAKALPLDHGRMENWAATWASDTILVAQEALIGTSYVKSGDGKWSVSFTDRVAYDRAADAIKRKQLAKAGAR